MLTFFTKKQNIIPTAILAVFAIALQIQITLFSNETYHGLRINLADIALPFLGIFILASTLLKRTKLPNFNIKHPIKWLVLLQCIFIAALFHSYINYQELIRWAFINKTIGFSILATYFLLGGWIANQIKEQQLHLFIKTLVYFFLLIMVLQTIDYSLYYLEIRSSTLFNHFPASGLIANKNTYFFLYLSILGLATFNRSIIPSYILLLLYSLLPITLIFTGARTAIFILPLLLPALFFFTSKENKKIIILSLIVGILSVFVFMHFQKVRIPSFKTTNYQSFSIVKDYSAQADIQKSLNNLTYAGDKLRIELLKTTLTLIKENPIIGSGLGSIIKEETSKDFPDTIMDSTPLWLWAETGLIGLFVFLSFYFICLKTIYKNGFNKENSETARNLNKSVLIIMLIFGLMCLLHELLYTRFLWFFMGLALAYPLKKTKLSVQHQN
jgi:O-antigen ligase